MQTKIIIKEKIVLLGNTGVGKTSILNYILQNEFNPNQQPTIGIDFMSKSFCVEGKTMRLQIWDTAGQERFHSLISSYIRDISCAILVFDLTSRHSFDCVEYWLKDILQSSNNHILYVLFGSKADSERVISYDEAKQYADEKELQYFEVSGKTGEGIPEALEDICLTLLRQNSFINEKNYQQQRNTPEQIGIKEKERLKQQKNNQCC